MHYRLLCVGRRARDPMLDAAAEFAERLQHYVKTEVLWLRDGTLKSERDDLMERLDATDHVIALDERGIELTTVELARKLERLPSSVRRAVFIIGGADGLHADIKARAKESWALSRLTLPHRLAQLLLLEQLYRAHTLLRGEPYHRA